MAGFLGKTLLVAGVPVVVGLYVESRFQESQQRLAQALQATGQAADLDQRERLVLTGMDLRNLALPGVHVTRTDIRSTNLRRANLVSACLGVVTGDDETDFSRANLIDVEFASGSDLTGARFRQARLTGARFGSARRIGDQTICGDTEDGVVNLSGADLSEAHLQRAILERASLIGAIFRGADLSDASLIDADLKSSVFIDADLRRSNLRGADLTSADLSGARVEGADFDGATLHDVTASCVHGRPRNFPSPPPECDA